MVQREPVLQQVARTCTEAAAAGADNGISIDAEAAAALGASLPAADVVATASHLRLPIKFESQEGEITALALLHLLDFGRGWDELLQQRVRRGAAELAQYGVLGLMLEGGKLDAQKLRNISSYQVFQHWGVDASEEVEVPNLPGVRVVRQGPLGGYTGAVRAAMTDAGKALEGGGHASLGSLILRLLDGQAAGGGEPSAAALVEQLAEAVPGFKDEATYKGQRVCFYRKAQALATQLHLRFRGTDPRFAFADADQLTLDSGAAMAAVLRQRGVLHVSDELAAAIDEGSDLQGDAREVLLRAATVAAGQKIAAAGLGAYQAYHLSAYLLQQAERSAEQQQQQASASGDAPAAPVQLKAHVARSSTAY